MIFKFIRSLKRTSKLYRLSQGFLKPFKYKNPPDHLNIQNALEDELIVFSLSDPIIVMHLIEHGYDEHWLRSLFKKLRLIVSLEYNNGFYIPASCLIDPCALYFLMGHFNGNVFAIRDYDNYNSSLCIADKLVKYFEKPDIKVFID